ncbi:MAG: redoxin family protein [Gammaproteobacteria bacterium]|nr:redoxin family protein [Gammaproteobacteria bacterium]MBU1555198.1 redoxin family protein [Gammaproteobacteria bacterium]MBU2071153.1 redoxin family protein [Gammaproteobacteria bacterium]MBU2184397.1 redoxin family protein [Gammaproteobacteria bacterium]MBU2206221.1 redoxin family protein [Gammaproteobacteria bacterium]
MLLSAALLLLVVTAKALAVNDDYRQLRLNTFPELNATSLQTLDNSKPLYVKLWASWCKPCLEQMPHFQKLYQQYGDKVNFVAVNIDINEKSAEIAAVIARFDLSMPVWLDVESRLAVALGLVGTPYSVLINSNGEQVYSSHESDALLDGFLQRLAKGQQLPAANTATLTAAAQQQLLQPYLTGEHSLFFTATWCDWYLADSRPLMSEACSTAQKRLPQLAAKLPGPPLKVIVNHLWTDDNAVTEFKQKYQLKLPVTIDEHGVLFRQFNVRTLPVLIQIKDGKVLTTTTDFN